MNVRGGVIHFSEYLLEIQPTNKTCQFMSYISLQIRAMKGLNGIDMAWYFTIKLPWPFFQKYGFLLPR